jgi:hypothetical protein
MSCLPYDKLSNLEAVLAHPLVTEYVKGRKIPFIKLVRANMKEDPGLKEAKFMADRLWALGCVSERVATPPDLSDALSDARQEVEGLHEDKRELYRQIENLEDVIEVLRQDIRDAEIRQGVLKDVIRDLAQS